MFFVVGLLQDKRNEIVKACERYGVARLDVFGSALRDDFRPGESDLDLLVEFKPMKPYERVEAYFGLLDDIRKLFNQKVDLVMTGAIKNQYIARDIDQTKQLLYAP